MKLLTAEDSAKTTHRARTRLQRQMNAAKRDREREDKKNDRWALKTIYPKDLEKVVAEITTARAAGCYKTVAVSVSAYDCVKDKIFALLTKKNYRVEASKRRWDGDAESPGGACWELFVSWENAK